MFTLLLLAGGAWASSVTIPAGTEVMIKLADGTLLAHPRVWATA